MARKIVDRTTAELGLPGLAEARAARIAGADLQSLLLQVFRERAARLGPADLLAQAQRGAMHEAGLPREEVRRSVRAHRFGSAAEPLQRRGVTLPGPVAGPGRELQGLGAAAALAVARLGRVKAALTDRLAAAFPGVRWLFDPVRLQGPGSCGGPCLGFGARDPNGARIQVGDGGFVAWTQRLLSDCGSCAPALAPSSRSRGSLRQCQPCQP